LIQNAAWSQRETRFESAVAACLPANQPTKQQAASSKQQAASSKQQAASSKQQGYSLHNGRLQGSADFLHWDP
jgi:hypothetical protein